MPELLQVFAQNLPTLTFNRSQAIFFKLKFPEIRKEAENKQEKLEWAGTKMEVNLISNRPWVSLCVDLTLAY